QIVASLMAELAGTENRVSVERRRFNESVQVYNVKVKRIPSNIIAALFGFDAREFFEAAEGAGTAPTVNLE
ncbi:MAG: LemA family protein, partial [Patescibacteria group bacterium]